MIVRVNRTRFMAFSRPLNPHRRSSMSARSPKHPIDIDPFSGSNASYFLQFRCGGRGLENREIIWFLHKRDNPCDGRIAIVDDYRSTAADL